MSHAKDEIEKITNEKAVAISQLQADRAAELKKILDDNERHAKSVALGEARRMKMTEKRTIIDDVLAEALARATKEFDADLQEKLRTFAVGNKAMQKGEIRAHPDKEAAIKKILAEVGVAWSIQSDPSIPNGFVFSSPEAEYEFSAKKNIERVQSDLEVDIANELFFRET